MSDETIHESKRPRSRRSIATYLRRIADALGRGERVPVDDEGQVAVDPPAEPNMDVELERGEDTISLGLELEWPAADGAVDTDADTSKATFELYEDSVGEYRWRLRHRNGNIIADSGEGYAARGGAEGGIESVKANAPGAFLDDQSTDDEIPTEGGSDATFELYEDSAGEYRWRLRHDNGNIIADSGQGYSSKQKAKQGLRSVRRNAPGAPVEEE
ncbi:HVO_2922 family protein [Natronomonas amylolytica]|uniref:HVO_2922 family protein n=1 Tax=Natronomonas amylolytica TaxID=3108498 RepID=UPI00300BB900